MSHPARNPQLPATIFGLPHAEHRHLRIKAFLAHYNVLFARAVSRVQLLRLLFAVEDQFSDRERRIICSWLQGAGLLSDLRLSLRKAGVVDRRVALPTASLLVVVEPSDQRTVPLSASQECNVCLTTLDGSAFPRRRVSSSCRHSSFTCLKCLKQTLDIQIRENSSDRVACPECPAVLEYQRIKEFASPEAFKMYVVPPQTIPSSG
jgi:hypothetical protein